MHCRFMVLPWIEGPNAALLTQPSPSSVPGAAPVLTAPGPQCGVKQSLLWAGDTPMVGGRFTEVNQQWRSRACPAEQPSPELAPGSAESWGAEGAFLISPSSPLSAKGQGGSWSGTRRFPWGQWQRWQRCHGNAISSASPAGAPLRHPQVSQSSELPWMQLLPRGEPGEEPSGAGDSTRLAGTAPAWHGTEHGTARWCPCCPWCPCSVPALSLVSLPCCPCSVPALSLVSLLCPCCPCSVPGAPGVPAVPGVPILSQFCPCCPCSASCRLQEPAHPVAGLSTR